ncbi:MAG: histidine triad nucleotide-binding protein [Elusimicrobiales bacterium]|nr:histidine triad nucleotide-binding protein [Elusimicrobiales bacterium]
MPNCIFCEIAEKTKQTRIIHETDDIMAFHDLNPQAPVHILIIPKKHISKLAMVKSEDMELLGKVQYAAMEIAKELGLSDFRLVMNNGKKAGQTVDHLHYHLLSGRRLLWPPG